MHIRDLFFRISTSKKSQDVIAKADQAGQCDQSHLSMAMTENS